MKKSTKKWVIHGTGVTVGVVVFLLTVVLIMLTNGKPTEKIGTNQMVNADVVELNNE